MVLNTTETLDSPIGVGLSAAKQTTVTVWVYLWKKKFFKSFLGHNISINGGISASELSFANDQNFKIIYCSKGSPIVRSDWHIGLGDAYYKGHIRGYFFSNLLSENLVDQVEGYLSHKWGLENDLPNDHSFKNLSSNGF